MNTNAKSREEVDESIGLLIEQIHEQLTVLRRDLLESRGNAIEAARLLRNLLEVLERDPNPSVIALRASIANANSWLSEHPELDV